MTVMWLTTSLLVWALVPNLPFLHALAIGSCVTPTDPVLSNVIVKGKFADHNVPKDLQQIIIAESGANDGLGYPFLFLALYLIKYVGTGGGAELAAGGAPTAMGMWFGETWGYTIILSVVYGATVGWIAKELLHCRSAKETKEKTLGGSSGAEGTCFGLTPNGNGQGPRSIGLSIAKVFWSLHYHLRSLSPALVG